MCVEQFTLFIYTIYTLMENEKNDEPNQDKNFLKIAKSTESFDIDPDEDLSLMPELQIKNKTEDINKMLNEIGMTNYHIKLLILCLIFCFADGAEMVVVSLIMRKLEKVWHLTPLKKAFMGGSIFYGFLIGALISGKLMDHKGRKFTFVLGSIIFFIFSILSSFSTEFDSFILFRIGVGFGIGFIIPTAQAFITEMSPMNYRGFNTVIIWIGFPLGEVYICMIAKMFPLDDELLHNSNWTILMLLAGFPVNICLIIDYF